MRHSQRHFSRVSVMRATCISRKRGTHLKTYRCMGWFGLLFIFAALACTTTASARDLTERGDHRYLAVWYEREAARQQQGKAEEILRMAAE